MSEIPLNVSTSAVFVSDGASGTVARTSLAPTVYGTKWEVQRVVVTTTSTGINGSSRFYMYRNSESPASLVDGTYSGDQDVNETDIQLQTLDRLLFVWTGGDIGSIATVILSGTMDTGR